MVGDFKSALNKWEIKHPVALYSLSWLFASIIFVFVGITYVCFFVLEPTMFSPTKAAILWSIITGWLLLIVGKHACEIVKEVIKQ